MNDLPATDYFSHQLDFDGFRQKQWTDPSRDVRRANVFFISDVSTVSPTFHHHFYRPKPETSGTSEHLLPNLDLRFVRKVLEGLPVACVCTDLKGNIVLQNDLFSLLVSGSTPSLNEVDWTTLAADLEHADAPIIHRFEINGEERTGECSLMTAPDGSTFLLIAFSDSDDLAVALTNARATIAELGAECQRIVEEKKQLEHYITELERAASYFAERAEIDGLTGVLNRGSFDEHYATLWEAATLNRKSVLTAIIDIDWFKGYNDTYGHLAGDEALRQVADAIAQEFPEGIFGRIGGEEFALALTGVAKTNVITIADRLIRRVRSLAILHAESAHHILTISAGLCYAPLTRNVTPTELLQAADTALYEAKDAGRNRYEIVGLDQSMKSSG